MLTLNCIRGAILGAIGGYIAYFVGYLSIWIVVGILTWNSDTGTTWAAFISTPAIPAGIIIGILVPICQAQDERNDLYAMLAKSQSTFLTLPELVDAADAHLKKAEHEFSERAFAPFWDEIEHATNQLGAYHAGVTSITSSARDYSSRRSRLSITIPEFSVPEDGFPDARPVAKRLSEIVRKGQRDFQFATLYEQRKTNQLLYTGFGTLAAGIERMQHAITDALEDLSNSLGSRLDDLVRSSHALADRVSTLTDEVASGAQAQREFEKDALGEAKKQSKMLDNIQRDRKPFL
jgi:hypothetical protein